MITKRFDTRRKAIFEEVERNNGSTWKQVLQVSLAEINAISTRIEATKPVLPTPPAPSPSGSIQTLPRISSQPLREDNILTGFKPSGSTLSKIGDLARSHGSSPGGPPISPQAAMKFIESTTDKVASRVMTPDNKAKIQKQGVAGFFTEIFYPLVRAPYIGHVFRQTFRRRANVVIASAPYSRISTITNAVTSVVELAVQSLKEDAMGQVFRDVPTIARTLGSTISAVEHFLKTTEPHWTDLDFKESDRRAVPEVEHLLGVLRDGLKKLLIAHGEYLQTEGMSGIEIKDVKALVGSEMKEKK
jgi:nucleoporin NDC1